MIANKGPEICDSSASDKTCLLSQKEEHTLKGHSVDGTKTQKQHPFIRNLWLHRSRKDWINDSLMWNILHLDLINIQHTRCRITIYSGSILNLFSFEKETKRTRTGLAMRKTCLHENPSPTWTSTSTIVFQNASHVSLLYNSTKVMNVLGYWNQISPVRLISFRFYTVKYLLAKQCFIWLNSLTNNLNKTDLDYDKHK